MDDVGKFSYHFTATPANVLAKSSPTLLSCPGLSCWLAAWSPLFIIGLLNAC
jgi:hypothetical protein